MELLLSGIALQALALALLALVVVDGDSDRALLVKLRSDGRADQDRDEAAEARRRNLVRTLIGLFVGGTLLALLGVPRI